MARRIVRWSAFLIGTTLCVAVAQPAAAWRPSPSECDYYARNEAQRAGSALGGAAKGAIGGAIFGAIVGKGRGAKTGAALGGILAGLGKAAQNEDIRRRAYDDCMAGYVH